MTLLLVLAVDRVAWLLELLAEAIIDRVPAELWHAIEDELPIPPILWRFLVSSLKSAVS